MSITRDNHSSPEKELNSTGAKMVQPSMEKIKEECDETEYGDVKNQRAQKHR